MTPTENQTLSRHSPIVSLRPARDEEADVVRRLADLDDSANLRGEVLLAVVDGEAVAAMSLDDGRVVANPFIRTADIVALLAARAAQLRPTQVSDARARRRRGRVTHLRAA